MKLLLKTVLLLALHGGAHASLRHNRQHWIWYRLLLPLLYTGRTDWTGTGHFPGQADAHCRDALVRGVPQVARLRSSRSAS